MNLFYKYIISLSLVFTIMPVHAVTMCVPVKSCTVDSVEGPDWSVTCGVDNAPVKGISICASQMYSYPVYIETGLDGNQENSNSTCWCRVTFPYLSGWVRGLRSVYDEDYGYEAVDDESMCHDECAQECVNLFMESTDSFRASN